MIHNIITKRKATAMRSYCMFGYKYIQRCSSTSLHTDFLQLIPDVCVCVCVRARTRKIKRTYERVPPVISMRYF